MKKIILIFIALTTLLQAKMQVCVSILPQKFFLQKIAGDLVDIEVLVQPGSSPATYAPKPSQLKHISKARLYFTIGVAFERSWLDRFKSINRELKIIDTTKDIKKITMQPHKEENDHKHKGLDPHVWLDPILVISQANRISDALIKEDPKNSKIYERNRDIFIKELHKLDKKIREILSDVRQKEFIVFHPSFGYFAKRYSLLQIAIEKEGKEPSLKYMKKVIDFAKKHNIKTIFVAPQFSQKSAKQIAKQIDGVVKTIDPLAEDWQKNMLIIAKSFQHK